MKDLFILENENKKFLFQWDLDQRFIINEPEVYQAHYQISNKEPPLSCEVYEENGVRFVNIPNILLQKAGQFRVYAYYINSTLDVFQFEVKPRPKPSDYIYTETELLSIEALVVDEITRAHESGMFVGPQGAPGTKGEKGDKGDKGDKGNKGDPGKTPEKGVDYWTEQDKQEIQNYVQEQIFGLEEELYMLNNGGIE